MRKRGTDCLTRAAGMFGVAVWLNYPSVLFWAATAWQETALYAQHASRLVFGSEIKALLAAVPELPTLTLKPSFLLSEWLHFLNQESCSGAFETSCQRTGSLSQRHGR